MSFLRNALLCTALLAAPSGWAQSDMSDAERAALHAEIRGYLLENPEIIMEVIGILDERRALGEAAAEASLVTDNSSAIYDDGYSFVGGNPDGDVTIVEFADYRCGYCKAAMPRMAELLAEDDGIRLVLKEFPILGPDSLYAAQAAIAASRVAPERYAAVHEALMGFRGEMSEAQVLRLISDAGVDAEAVRAEMAEAEAEIDALLRANYEVARALQIQGTPSFVIGGAVARGLPDISVLREMVAEARAEAG
jgi:protein-disulfide isomerase